MKIYKCNYGHLYYTIPTTEKNMSIIVSERDDNGEFENKLIYEEFYKLYLVRIIFSYDLFLDFYIGRGGRKKNLDSRLQDFEK